MIAPLFDDIIQGLRPLAEAAVPLEPRPWPDAGRRNLVLQSEMAYELGAGRLPAVSLFAASPLDTVPEGDRAYLLGPDLPDIRQNAPYARAALVRLAGETWQEESALYASLTRVRNARYTVSPEGYMPRMDSNAGREPVRVSRAALRKGLTFAHAAELYRAAYRRYPEVLGVTQLFITAPDFDYKTLRDQAQRSASILSALDHILKDFKMDCDTCKLQAVCSEVEGLRDLHFNR